MEQIGRRMAIVLNITSTYFEVFIETIINVYATNAIGAAQTYGYLVDLKKSCKLVFTCGNLLRCPPRLTFISH